MIKAISKKLGFFQYGCGPSTSLLCERPKVRLSNGDQYAGQWLIANGQNIREGKGVCYYADGSVYQGWWCRDQPHGWGRFINAKTHSAYQGQWLQGKMHGFGDFLWKNGSKAVGHFRNDMIHGQAKFIGMSGKIYDGQWHRNQKHGLGVLEYPDGRVYQGRFRYDVKDGQGVQKWPDGRIYAGGWSNNK